MACQTINNNCYCLLSHHHDTNCSKARLLWLGLWRAESAPQSKVHDVFVFTRFRDLLTELPNGFHANIFVQHILVQPYIANWFAAPNLLFLVPIRVKVPFSKECHDGGVGSSSTCETVWHARWELVCIGSSWRRKTTERAHALATNCCLLIQESEKVMFWSFLRIHLLASGRIAVRHTSTRCCCMRRPKPFRKPRYKSTISQHLSRIQGHASAIR